MIPRPTLVVLGLILLAVAGARGQDVADDGIERTGPPSLDTLELDANQDGVPDGWYNLRDVKVVDGGISSKSKCFRFEADKPGRPARASRAFGVDGRKTEALVIGFWVRLEKPGLGDRIGDEPGLIIDFLGDKLRATRRGMIGPLTRSVGVRWTHVAKRFSVPPDTRDAILSVGLLGATGMMEVDDLSIQEIPVGGSSTTNLVMNGDFELGDPAPNFWTVEGGASRTSPGYQSTSAAELTRLGSRLMVDLAQTVERYPAIELTVAARGREMRGADGAIGMVFFLDADGRPLPGFGNGVPAFRWSGSFAWRIDKAMVNVPRGASHAVLQFDKTTAYGSILLDDVTARPAGEVRATRWTPYHETTNVSGWQPVEPSPQILKGSALDASSLLEAPAGARGFVAHKDGHLVFSKGGRARFFGVVMLAPSAYMEAKRADELADRLARSGINLVRLGDLDAPFGPSRSLIDDSREDTKELDPGSLVQLDHLIAALKARGIYIAVELQGLRRFRAGDDIPEADLLPNGGGPAAAFDPNIRGRALEFATKLLTHVNPETGLALKDDPVLAWVTLAGELSLFDLIDTPNALPPKYHAALKAKGSGRSAWKTAESNQWTTLAGEIRKLGVKVPIAGNSHWRREPEFASVQSATGLDLIDDRLFWSPPSHGDPDRRSMLWSRDGGIRGGAASKRKGGFPYVVGQYCSQTRAWALPFEGADLLLAASTASADDWDALTRRGLFLNPEVWGSAAPGTTGGDDLFAMAEVVNAIPPVFALLPHAATLLLRDHPEKAEKAPRARAPLKGADARKGRLTLDTPHVQGVAGWFDGTSVPLDHLLVEPDSKYSVVVASSLGAEPIATAKRLLVTAIAQVEPTGLSYVDRWRKDVADIGRPPLLAEPVKARVVWRTKQKVKGYALDNTGARVREIPLLATTDGPCLVIDGNSPGFHWELTSE